jgi:hypothetical protein
VYCFGKKKWSFALVGMALMVMSDGGCSKSRADDFSKFKPSESVQSPGAAPQRQLRYRPVAGRDVTYQLTVNRQCPALGLKAKMRLRVALKVESRSTGGGAFVLRFVSLQRLEPLPPGGLPDLGPAYVLLRGQLGPRGRLTEIQDSDRLPTPVNLALALPLLLPRLPNPGVGIGASWRASSKLGWKRTQSADSLTNQPGFSGSTDVLLRSTYKRTADTDTKQPVILGDLTFRLRSHTRALSHTSRHRGKGKASARYVLDPATSLPVHAKVTLQGTYKLHADDKTAPIKETLELTFRQD